MRKALDMSPEMYKTEKEAILIRHPSKNKDYWADDKQSKARNSDGKYRQMALVGFDT